MEKQKNKPRLRFTEFGGEWEKKKLGDETTWRSGGTPSKENPSYWNGEIPWISASSMRGTEYSDSNLKISELGLKNGSRIAKKGSLLILVRGSMLFNTIPIGIAKRDVAFNQDVKAIELIQTGNSKFLLQWFISNENKLLNLVTGTGIGAGKLDLQDLQLFPYLFPSLPEQTKIASFLTAVDEKLQSLKKKKSLLEAYKKGVMQKLFSQDIRFQDQDGNDFPDWEVKKLGEVGKFYAGGDLDKLDYQKVKSEKYSYPIFANGAGEGLYGYASTYQYNSNCVTVSGRGNLGYANVRNEKFNAIVRLIVIEPKEFMNSKFLEESINNLNFVIESTGVPQLTVPQISTYKILIPSLPEQAKIANFLSALDEKINHTQAQIEKTEVWKKGLLQGMFV